MKYLFTREHFWHVLLSKLRNTTGLRLINSQPEVFWTTHVTDWKFTNEGQFNSSFPYPAGIAIAFPVYCGLPTLEGPLVFFIPLI